MNGKRYDEALGDRGIFGPRYVERGCLSIPLRVPRVPQKKAPEVKAGYEQWRLWLLSLPSEDRAKYARQEASENRHWLGGKASFLK